MNINYTNNELPSWLLGSNNSYVDSRSQKNNSNHYPLNAKELVDNKVISTNKATDLKVNEDGQSDEYADFLNYYRYHNTYSLGGNFIKYEIDKLVLAIDNALLSFEQKDEFIVDGKYDFDKGKNLKPLLFIQGDFNGIQNFIFSDGGYIKKKANKLLRGRSFMVSMLGECALMKICDSLNINLNSVIINAAGKFVLIAPNNKLVQLKLEECRKDFNHWFLDNTFALQGISISATEVQFADLQPGEPFRRLQEKLAAANNLAKSRLFSLTNSADDLKTETFDGIRFNVLDKYENKACEIQGNIPADEITEDGTRQSKLAQDQINFGNYLLKKQFIALVPVDIKDKLKGKLSELEYFGYHMFFADDNIINLDALTAEEKLKIRRLDISRPESDGNVWTGSQSPRRFFNTYAPVFAADEAEALRYAMLSDDDDRKIEQDKLKTFNHLATEDQKILDKDGTNREGVTAIGVIKGDIDNLGALFQKTNDLVSWMQLSRLINQFFTIWLPWACEHGETHDKEKYACLKNIYTVFAGGDDFFLIGPWKSCIFAAATIREEFDNYCKNNRFLNELSQENKINFSAGLTMYKPSIPIRHIARMSNDALDSAKSIAGKNKVQIWGQNITWDDYKVLTRELPEQIKSRLTPKNKDGQAIELSAGLCQDLMELSDDAGDENNNKKWISKLHYRIARWGEQNRVLDKEIEFTINQLCEWLTKYKQSFKIPLSMVDYDGR